MERAVGSTCTYMYILTMRMYVHVHVLYCSGLFSRGVYSISQISQNENFREDCTREVAMLGTWCGFLLIMKINSVNRSNFEIREIYTP